MDTCIITGTIAQLGGAPKPDVMVSATVQETTDGAGQIAGGGGITAEPLVTFTGDDGTFTLELVQGAKAVLEIQAVGLKRHIDVPMVTGPVDFLTLI